jgi:GGDEF domain-containing protein
MNLESYRKEFSVFIFNENIHMARLQKESLSTKGYETHFYSSKNLFTQAIYLTLPHVVVLPYFEGVQEIVLEVKKTSKEILIVMCGEEAQLEHIMALVDRGLVYDFVLNPAKNIKSFMHRIDQAVEKWVISMSKEQAGMTDPIKEIFVASAATNNLTFIEEDAKETEESALSQILHMKSEKGAVQATLQQLARMTGKEFIFLKNDVIGETLVLTDMSIGLTAKFHGLGIKYADIPRAENFWQEPQNHVLWAEFFKNIFKANETTNYALKNSEQLLGYIVSIGALAERESILTERFGQALGVLLDNFSKTRWNYDYATLDRKTECLNNKTFYEKTSLEVSRSRRLGLPVSALSFEITCEDEIFNQRSALLVAKILKRFTRSTDFVGRVRENRFAVLFPHTAQEPAAKKAGILLGIIKAALEEKQWSGVYVAAGVNVFPEQCSDSLGLLQGSEEACDQADAFEVLMNERNEKSHNADI